MDSSVFFNFLWIICVSQLVYSILYVVHITRLHSSFITYFI